MKIKQLIRQRFGRRKVRTGKEDYGRVLVLAGSRGMSGACYLTSMAVLRSGAGLVTVGVPKSLAAPLTKRFTEAMMLVLPETTQGTLSARAYRLIMEFMKRQSVLVVGPGLSLNRSTQSLVRKVVAKCDRPMVIDADGLNAFKGKANLLKRLRGPAILTPHDKEFVRLFGGKLTKNDTARRERARAAALKYGVTVLLKGHHTVVASLSKPTYVNKTGNPGMATGGSGDVLTGVIGGLLAQGVPPHEAACIGSYLHGLSGDLSARKKSRISMVAGDILNTLPEAFKKAIGSA